MNIGPGASAWKGTTGSGGGRPSPCRRLSLNSVVTWGASARPEDPRHEVDDRGRRQHGDGRPLLRVLEPVVDPGSRVLPVEVNQPERRARPPAPAATTLTMRQHGRPLRVVGVEDAPIPAMGDSASSVTASATLLFFAA